MRAQDQVCSHCARGCMCAHHTECASCACAGAELMRAAPDSGAARAEATPEPRSIAKLRGGPENVPPHAVAGRQEEARRHVFKTPPYQMQNTSSGYLKLPTPEPLGFNEFGQPDIYSPAMQTSNYVG